MEKDDRNTEEMDEEENCSLSSGENEEEDDDSLVEENPLVTLFSNLEDANTSESKAAIHEEILRLLRSNPTWAQELISFEDDDSLMRPFPALIRTSGRCLPTAVLQEVYDLYPNAVSEEVLTFDKHEEEVPMHPIDYAIKCGAAENVILFLLEKCPSQHLSADSCNCVWSTSGGVSLSLTKVLAQRFPPTNSVHLCGVLTRAFHSPTRLDALQYLAESFPEDGRRLSYVVDYGGRSYPRRTFRGLLPLLKKVKLLGSVSSILLVLADLQSEDISNLVNLGIFVNGVSRSEAKSRSTSISETVRAILARNNNIEELSLRFHVEWSSILDILKSNTKLKTLEVKETDSVDLTSLAQVVDAHNATLEDFRFFAYNTSHHEGYDKLEYLLQLNKFGRGTARHLSSTSSTIGSLLIAAKQDASLDGAEKRLNVYYGLLRESPGLWSTEASNSCLGKRKRNEVSESYSA